MDIAYPIIMQRLKDELPEVKFIDLFCNQFEVLLSEENKGYPFDFPAILIEFGEFQWGTRGGTKIQHGTGIIRFHIGLEFYPDTHSKAKAAQRNKAMQILGFRKKVHLALQGFSGSNFSALDRVNSIPDKNFGGLYICIEEYQTVLRDDSADPKKNWTTTTPDLKVEKGIE